MINRLCGLLLIVFVSSIPLNGCQPQTDAEKAVTGEGIAIEGSWARPAPEGRMSAAYFLITNFEQEADTLISVSSGVANLTEIHESFEQEGGMVGMREAGLVVIPANGTIRFEPGGLHVMLIQATQPLIADETIELTLSFARQGEVTITIPVRR